MSLPPSTIRIKRKLDEAPVQALYIDRSETKRQKVKKDFVFRLARTVTSPTDPTPQPFQPQHRPRNSLSGIPQVRSTLTPSSRSRPASPSLGVPRGSLASRTPSPGHGIGPLPAGSKLALDTSDASSSRKSKFKAPLSAIARADSYENVNVESPASIASTAPIGAKDKIVTISNLKSLDDGDGPVRKGTFGDDKPHSLSTSPNDKGTDTVSSSPSSTSGKRKAVSTVRRYHLAKRIRIKHPHPYSTAATRRSAIFIRESSEPSEEDVSMQMPIAEEEKPADQQDESIKARKRPRTHPEERKRIEEKRKLELEREKAKQKGTKTKVKFEEQSELDPLTLAMQNMVFEYLNSENNDGVRNLPATNSLKGISTKSKMQVKIGGGLGGGTWKDVDKKKGLDEDLEDEEGFVYDVYIREEVKPENSKEGEDYGLIIINGGDDEEWWYEGDEDVDSDDVYGSDDEDSNAEDYHTNDYPEESPYDSDDADDLDEFGVIGIDSADDGDDDDSDDRGTFKSWNKQKKFADDEEFDLEYDEDVDAEAEHMRRKMAGIWGYRDGRGVTGGRVVSGDEMED